jgi:hypothetical protein
MKRQVVRHLREIYYDHAAHENKGVGIASSRLQSGGKKDAKMKVYPRMLMKTKD